MIAAGLLANIDRFMAGFWASNPANLQRSSSGVSDARQANPPRKGDRMSETTALIPAPDLQTLREDADSPPSHAACMRRLLIVLLVIVLVIAGVTAAATTTGSGGATSPTTGDKVPFAGPLGPSNR